MMLSIFRAVFKRLPVSNDIKQFFRLPGSYLETTGWNISARNKKPLSQDGKPIPWLTFGIIHFLQDRIPASANVFEYGSGNSTLWFSERCNSIVSVEHDEAWYTYIYNELKQRDNVTYHNISTDTPAYEEAIKLYEQLFDIVLIDGRKRNECSTVAVEKLSPNGVIIWDNSERDRYQSAINALVAQGFKRLDFMGLSPATISASVTTIFYRDANCLGI